MKQGAPLKTPAWEASLQCVRCHARKARQIKCLLTEGKDNDYVSDSVLYSTDQSSRVHCLALT